MKKIILLFAVWAIIGCHKDDIVLPTELQEDTTTPSTEKEKKESDPTPTPESPEDASLSRNEKLFRRLANSCLRGEEGVEVGDLNIQFNSSESVPSEYRELYAKFLKTYPFFFHLTMEGSLSVHYKTEDPTQLRRYNFLYSIPPHTLAEWIPRVEQSLEEYYSCLREGMSEAEIAYALYNKLIEKTRYTETMYAASALGGIVVGEAVCQGYSLAYCILMESIGIQTDYIRGPIAGSTGHMWNRVFIDGEWYNMDATWDDNTTKKANTSFPQAQCLGSYLLTSDQTFYETKEHPRAYKIPKIPQATSNRFKGKEYFFRNNSDQTKAAYLKGYWYYLSMKDMCIYRSRFDGSSKKVIHQLLRSPKEGMAWKQLDFGADRMYFTDKINGTSRVCSIGYDGENFQKGRSITYFELIQQMSLNQSNDVLVRKEFGTVALRAEVVLAKLKDAYYHDMEDYYIPENPNRIVFVNTIEQAENFLKSSVKDENQAGILYHKLHEMRKKHSMPMTCQK